MRLFIAINFTGEIRDRLCETIEALKKQSIKGRFTSCENLHLTVVFIGETTRVDEVKRAMDKLQKKQFTMKLGGFGRFNRSGGDIYWVGVKKSDELPSIYKQLFNALTEDLFELETRGYTPHLTLGREVTVQEGFDMDAFEKAIPQMEMMVGKISLMKSEQIKGKLTYTEIYARELSC